MRAGLLRNVVRLQALSEGVDESGTPSGGWADVATVYADIRHASGIEAIKGGTELSIVRASVRIRWRTDVTPAMRVLHGATTYEIKAVLPDLQRREYLDLVCEVVR